MGWTGHGFTNPDALPPEILSDKVRNGHLDRKLSFPLADLYGDGQPCGQVGQEICGCGAAFVYASRAFHRSDDMPFKLFCDRRLQSLTEAEGGIALVIDAPAGCASRFVVRGKSGAPRKSLKVATAFGLSHPLLETDDRLEVETPFGSGAVTISW